MREISGLADLLVRATQSLVERCRSDYCDPAPPSAFCFQLGDGQHMALLSPADIVGELVHPDGSFREWINLSPVAISQGKTVFKVEFADRFTTRMVVGALAFPFEPFHLLGPNLPANWSEGDPIPKVSLPRLGTAG